MIIASQHQHTYKHSPLVIIINLAERFLSWFAPQAPKNIYILNSEESLRSKYSTIRDLLRLGSNQDTFHKQNIRGYEFLQSFFGSRSMYQNTGSPQLR